MEGQHRVTDLDLAADLDGCAGAVRHLVKLNVAVSAERLLDFADMYPAGSQQIGGLAFLP